MFIYRIEDHIKSGPFYQYNICYLMTELAIKNGCLVNNVYHEAPLFPTNGEENLWLPDHTWRCGLHSKELFLEWFPKWSWEELARACELRVNFVLYEAYQFRQALRQCIFNPYSSFLKKSIPLQYLSEKDLENA